MTMPNSFFPTQSGAPQMPQVFSKEALNQAGVQTFGFGKDFTDNYINSQMAQYNNAYNYWLWQQQALYNSPAEQVKRLKEAGLNPNYNAIEGAGNLKDTPSSKADIHSSAGASGRENMALTLNYANSILEAVKKGIEMTSEIAALPSDIRLYRKHITQQMEDKTKAGQLNNWLKQIEGAAEGYYSLGIAPSAIQEPMFLNGIFPVGYTDQYLGRVDRPVSLPLEAPKYLDLKSRMLYRDVMTNANRMLAGLRSGQISLNAQQLKNMKQQERILKASADFAKWHQGAQLLGEVVDPLTDIYGGFLNYKKSYFYR